MTLTETPDESIIYPTHRVLGVLDDWHAAEHVQNELVRMRLADDLWVFDASRTARTFDPSNSQDGWLHRMVRNLQSLVSYEADQMQQYIDATAGGALLFGVKVDTADQIRRVTNLFQRHDGRLVRHYGPFAIQNLHNVPSAR